MVIPQKELYIGKDNFSIGRTSGYTGKIQQIFLPGYLK